MTIILVFCFGLFLMLGFCYIKNRKKVLSREYVLICDKSEIIQVLSNHESKNENFYTRLVLKHNGTYKLNCSASHMMDSEFNLSFKNNGEAVIMVVVPCDSLADSGSTECNYIMKLDKLMKQYAKKA